MAEKSGFFDAHLVDGKYDRVYLADSFAKYFASFVGNGVFGGKSNELMVRQKDTPGMSVTVLSGQAFINGYWYENDDDLSLAVDIADGTLNRIDLIVVRWDNINRVIRLAVKKGTPSPSPAAPTLQRDGDYYELKLAQIRIRAGSTSIIDADITDTRLNKEVCGFVQGLIKQFDTTDFGAQLDSFIELFESENIAKMNAVLARLNSMADNNDVASLIFDIENLGIADKEIGSKIAIINQTLGYTKKNLLPYPYKANTQVIYGVTFTDNGDGTITVDGTPTGSPTGSAVFQLNNIKLDTSKKYLITDGVSASGETYYTQLYSIDAKNLPSSDKGEFTPEDVTYLARIVIKTSVSNLTFKPMIRRADIIDGSWEPYKPDVDVRLNKIAIEDSVHPGCFYRMNPTTNLKEWINPPRVSGVEYRLTERWNGKVLYQKTVDIASLPNSSIAYIDTKTVFLNMVSVTGYAYNDTNGQFYSLPVYLENKNMPSAVINKVDPNGYVLLTTSENMTAYNAEVVIKYTKQ